MSTDPQAPSARIRSPGASALVGLGDAVTTAERLIEQRALRSGPAGNLLAQVAVKLPEVLLHFSKVGEQLSGRTGELLVPVTLAYGVKHRDLPTVGSGDLFIDFGAPPPQLDEAAFGIVLRTECPWAQ